MTLQELRKDLERRAAEADRIGSTAQVAIVIQSMLEDLAAVDVEYGEAVRSGHDAVGAEHDRLLTVREAAARLGVAPRWLYRHASRLPFMKRLSSRVLRASESSLERYMAARRA